MKCISDDYRHISGVTLHSFFSYKSHVNLCGTSTKNTLAMNRLSALILLVALSAPAYAQFGPPGGGGGGMGGPPGMGGYRQGQQDSKKTKEFVPGVDSNAPKGSAKLGGILTDSASGKPVEYATIALIDATTGKPVDGGVSDGQGKFSLKNLPAGTFRLQYSFIGYQTRNAGPIQLEKNTDMKLGTVTLAPDVRLLGEVTVTGQRAMIEEKVDRLVFNAEKDLTARGGDAADLLRKVPLLSVDLDGNVSLRGSTNIRVLINNKPSTIVAANVADALKQLPSDMIKSVEVITSPSAKYDAEGSAGIINIITKKNTLHGMTMTVDAGAGTRGSNLGLNGSYREGKLGISLGGFGRYMYNRASSTFDQTTLLPGGGTQRSLQQNSNFDNPLFGSYSLSADYDLKKDESLSASVRYGTRNFVQSQSQFTQTYLNNVYNGNPTTRDIQQKNLSNSIDASLDYLRTYGSGEGNQTRPELSLSLQLSRANVDNNYTANLLSGTSSEILRRQRNVNDNTNQELTFQADYQTPLGSRQLLEVGGKAINRQVNSQFEYLAATGNSDLFVPDLNSPSGSLDYQQGIQAGYVSYTYASRSKYTLKAGVRYEHTGISAFGTDGKSLGIPDYGNLVPSVNLSKQLSQTTTLKAAYNRRIQRPFLQMLNPNVNASNPLNITKGNPYLSPELTDNVELSLSTTVKKVYLNWSVFGRQTNNEITQVRIASDSVPGAIITTFANIGFERTIGTNVFGNVQLTPKWSINGGVDLYYRLMRGQVTDASGRSETRENAGTILSGRLTSQWSLGKWGIQANGFVSGPRIQLQGQQGGMYMYSVGVLRNFANKQGSIGLAAENFAGGVQMVSTFSSPTLQQESVMRLYNQNVKLTFNYRFGKMTFQPKKRRTNREGGGNGNGEEY
ncbi:TonB-dependent receptor [Fibrella aestuarina BUZ 2]|uniref:TonB-dependent receptor n=2 Tax=Fibrella TaxID=861914 RepID=I0K7G3_9BACT|nr:TonB-dependent receptor [Fibrella aestuarina BUZ 2]